MNAAVRVALVRAAFVGTGVVAGAGGAVAVTSGARETITLAIGDSIVPRFSVKTDSVLAVVGSRIVAKRCGQGAIYLRTWRGTSQVSADTVTANVPCSQPSPETAATVGVCFVPSDSAAKYHIDGSKTLDSSTLKLVQPWCKSPDTLHLVPVAPASPAIQRKA